MGLNPNGSVLIFTPTLGLNPNPFEYQSSLLKIINQIQTEKMGLAYFPTYRQLWHDSNNQAWNTAFEHKFEYILRMDDDIWGVPDDAFSKLLKADKDVIGAEYHNRRWPFFPAAMRRTKNISLIEICVTDDRSLQYVDETDSKAVDGVVPVDLVGFGLTLIKTEPFRYLERPIYLGHEDVPDDTFLAQVCLDNGIQEYVHTGVKVNHSFVTPMNAGYLYNAGVFEKMNSGEVKTVLSEEEKAMVQAQEVKA